MSHRTPTPGPDDSRPDPPPGPIYDNALRQLAADELLALCRWLGIDADPGAVRLSEAFPAMTQYVDLLVGCGPGRLAQVEFVRRPTADLPWRLLEYRARIMRLEPATRLRQHVVVLAGGRLAPELTDGSDVWTRFHVTYLREQEPERLLGDPSLAPLAPLGRLPAGVTRDHLLREALDVIRRESPPERATGLAALALVLAAIHLDPDTIETARRETAMPISLEGTVAGRILEQRAHARGEADGRAAGRSAGEQAVLAELLAARFGPDPSIPAVATRLAALGEQAAVSAVLGASSLEALLDRLLERRG